MESRRILLQRLALMATFGGVMPAASRATEVWPTRTIRLIVPYSAGGPIDVTARVLGNELSTIVGQPVVVENVPGASGKIAMEQVLRSRDSHALVINNTTASAISNVLDARPTFDLVKDLKPIVAVSKLPLFLVVNAKLPVSTPLELVAYAKANPTALSYASFGVGSPQHVLTERFIRKTGISMVHIPYKGDADASVAFINNTIQVMFVATAKRAAEDPRLRVLAVAAPERWFNMPATPTLGEVGVGDVAFEVCNGIYVPARVSNEVAERMNVVLNQALSKPAVTQKLAEIGYRTIGGGSDVLGARTRGDVELFRAMLAKGELKTE